MTVKPDSRYVSSTYIEAEDRRHEGVVRKFIYTYNPIRKDVPIQDIVYLKQGQRLDQLAYEYAGDSTLWWVIADVNDIIDFPLSLPAGTKIKIPAKEVFDSVRSGGL